jgi:hypothetical protein
MTRMSISRAATSRDSRYYFVTWLKLPASLDLRRMVVIFPGPRKPSPELWPIGRTIGMWHPE